MRPSRPVLVDTMPCALKVCVSFSGFRSVASNSCVLDSTIVLCCLCFVGQY